MKIDPTPLHIAQLVLVGLTLCLSIAIIGTAAHTLHVFNSQQSTNPWWLPLWPQHFDTHSTSALIGSAASVVMLNAIFLIFTLVPRVCFSTLLTCNILLTISVQRIQPTNLPRFTCARNCSSWLIGHALHSHLRPHS